MKEKTNIEKNDKGDDYRRVDRGGSWLINAWYTRVSNRNWGGASYRGNDLGFRLVLQTTEKK